MYLTAVLLSLVLAEDHGHGHAGIAPWMVLLGIFILVSVVVGIVALVLFLSGKLPPEDESLGTTSGGKPAAPPVSGATATDTPPGRTDVADDPEQALQRYLDREDEIMALLKQKGRSVAQSELCQYLGLTADELAGALSDLEQRGFLCRTWDRERQDFMVSLAAGEP